MWWRLRPAEYQKRKGYGNREAFKRRVVQGPPPGLLAYEGARAVGWVSVAPRSEFPRLERARFLKGRAASDAWSIPCFFVDRSFRGKGVGTALLKAAVKHARQAGAAAIEGYPTLPRRNRLPDAFAYMGTPGLFRAAGFVEAAQPSPSRRIMKYSGVSL